MADEPLPNQVPVNTFVPAFVVSWSIDHQGQSVEGIAGSEWFEHGDVRAEVVYV